jgi:hypothetical protein
MPLLRIEPKTSRGKHFPKLALYQLHYSGNINVKQLFIFIHSASASINALCILWNKIDKNLEIFIEIDSPK